MTHHLVGHLQRRSERTVRIVGVLEPLGQLRQQILNQLLALLQIDQQIVRVGKKDVIDVQHGDLVRLVVPLGDVVKVDRTVVRDEAHLGARIARQTVQMLDQRPAHRVQVAGLLGQRGYVQQEQVDCRLRWSEHVLRRSDELDRAGFDLGSPRWVTVRFRHRIVLELFRQFVHPVAQIALPLFAVHEEHERVDVRPAGPAAHDRVAGDHRQVVQIPKRMYQHAQRKSRLLQQLVRFRNLGQRAPENVRIAVDGLLERMVQVDDGRPHLARRQNVPVLEQIHRVVAPEPVEPTLDHVVLRVLLLVLLLLLLMLVLMNLLLLLG